MLQADSIADFGIFQVQWSILPLLFILDKLHACFRSKGYLVILFTTGKLHNTINLRGLHQYPNTYLKQINR